MYLHPGVNVHQSSSGYRLHDAIIVLEDLLQLCITMAIGGTEHQRAHYIGDGPGHRWRRVKSTTAAGQQFRTETVHLGQNWRQIMRDIWSQTSILIDKVCVFCLTASYLQCVDVYFSPMSCRRLVPSPNRVKELWTRRRCNFHRGV